jgi:hypothetical protein
MQLESTATGQSGWRQHLWIAILVLASVAFTFGLACAAPLAAFAAAAALTMSRRNALYLVGAVWFANQAVGFGVLGYPWIANTIGWGVVMGIAGIAGMETARLVDARLGAASLPVRHGAGLLVAFAAYEVVLFAAAVTALGATEDFTPAIIGEMLAYNVIALMALYLLNQVGLAIGLVTELEPRGLPRSA